MAQNSVYNTHATGFVYVMVLTYCLFCFRYLLSIKFAVRCLKYSDFHSIKRFLQQLFLKAPVNLSDMSSELIKQSNISTVIKV